MNITLTNKEIKIGRTKYKISGTFSIHKDGEMLFVDDFDFTSFEINGKLIPDEEISLNDIDLVLDNLETSGGLNEQTPND